MTTVETTRPRTRIRGSAAIIALACLAAVVVNLVLYAAGLAAGASYDFTAKTGPAHVDPLTLTGFTLVPLIVGLVVTAALPSGWRWVRLASPWVAVLVAIVSIPPMPLAVDLDAPSKVVLSACHLVAGSVGAVAVLRLRPRAPGANES